MTPRGASPTPDAAPATGRAAEALHNAAMVLLITLTIARCFVGELPFRTPSLRLPTPGAADAPLPANRTELSGVIFDTGVLAAAVLWLLAAVARRRLTIRRPTLAIPIILFMVFSAVSATGAADASVAWQMLRTQSALLLAGFLAVQLFDSRRRAGLLVVVLAATAAAMVVRGAWHIYETPYRISELKASSQPLLTQLGWESDAVAADSLSVRAASYAPTGYIGLSNIFASAMLIFLGGTTAVAVARLHGARKDRLQWRPRQKGQLHVPTLLAVAAVVLAAAAAAVLCATASRGAIAAGVLAAGASSVLCCYGGWAARRRGRLLAAVAVVVLIGAAAIAAWGTSHHRLPSKTMTFRWLYWRAGAAALAQRPMFGVGGGNFPTAYLRHRQGASEEAVKVPHNVLVHALVQFGIAGGGCYLAMLTGMLGGIARPAAKDRVEAGGGARAWVVITAAAAGVFVARALLADMASAPGLILVDAIPAAIIVAVVAAACRYRGGAADGPTLTPAGRVIIACGLAAFVLHNMVSFSLWTPGPAMLFWVTAGMVLATGDGGWTWGWKYVQWPASVLAVLVMLGAGAFDLVPRLRKTILTETASSQLARGDWAAAQQSLRAAAAADPGDAETHENVAMALLYERPATRPIAIVRHIEAYAHAQKAAALDRDNVNRYRRMADIANALAAMSAPGDWPVKAREHWAAAVALNPADSHLRMAYAEFLADRKRWKPCLEQLAAAEHIQQQLIQPSAQTFTDAQRSSLERLKARCREGIGPQRR